MRRRAPRTGCALADGGHAYRVPVPESVEAWWSRRQFSHGIDVPYPVGRYRDAWAAYPVLIRQYHPDLNRGVVLSQVPPAADVYLQWQCDAGHVFVATPTEQRERPGRERRRSTWCPECFDLARGRPTPAMRAIAAAVTPPAAPRPRKPKRAPVVCELTPDLPVGTPFVSRCAPKPASAVESDLRADLAESLEFDGTHTAVRLARPFFQHLEAWPDIVIPELQVAIEYDSPGRHGLEHVGDRERSDRRKDRLLREAGWEVVRVRTGRLAALGPHDVVAASLSKQVVPRILDELEALRGALFVAAYRR